MLNNPRKVIFRSVGLLILLGILLFAYFRYARYLKGPEIVSINMERFMETENPSLEIKALIKNTQSVILNERDIILNNKTDFKEILVFSPGANTIEIELKDTFGKAKKYTYTIFYRQKDIPEYAKTLQDAKDRQSEIIVESELTDINQ